MISYTKPIIVIAGASASGKSKIAIALAKDINGVIINGDSRQVYKELKIGTARPNDNEMEGIEHYLYGHISINDKYNIYQYQRDVEKTLNKLPSDKIPIIVGGTGLYIDSVIYNYILQEDDTLKKEDNALVNLSVKELQSMIDKETLGQLNRSDIVNPVRLRRIIEKGKAGSQRGEKLNCLYFVLNVDKRHLEKNIKERVNKMFENGLLEENINVRKNNLKNSTLSKIIGYQEFEGYFEKDKTLEEVKQEIVKNTTRYAKRQRTWFRRNKEAIWTNSYDLILQRSTKFITTE